MPFFICRRKDSGFRYRHDRAGWALLESPQLKIELKSELSDLSDDDNAANKTYESRTLEGESSSDESDEENMGIFKMERQFWIILYHKSLWNALITLI
ncbi:UNVERIFIED_CONTAM: hypothetical protein NCL1_37988 [Trichonephila clavipes]